MPTTVTSTIGTGGTYTTLAAWEAASPANLVTADQIWRGECKNEQFSAASTLLTIAGITTDATRYVELTTEAGASFRDNVNKLTNPLRYDSTGARLTASGHASRTINNQVSNTRISNLMIQNTHTGSASVLGETSGTPTACFLENCILDGAGTLEVLRSQSGQYTVINSLFMQRRASGDSAVLMQAVPNKTFRGCTFVRPSNLTAAANAIDTNYNTTTVQDCAVFGFTGFKAGSSTYAGNNNATDLASVGFGSNHQTSLTYTAQFEQSSDASGAQDFRAKGTGSLPGNGVTDAALTVDIIGQTRANPPTIGCWEFVASGVTVTVDFGVPMELLTNSLRSASALSEELMAPLHTSVAAVELLTTVRGDNTAQLEELMIAQRSGQANAELLTSIVTIFAETTEVLTSLLETLSSPLEALAAPLGSLGVPMELLGATSVELSVGVPLELQAGVLASIIVPDEVLASARRDSTVVAEVLAGALHAAGANLELLTRGTFDTVLHAELSVSFAMGTQLGLEWQVSAFVDAQGNVEFTGVTPVSFGVPVEFTGVSGVPVVPDPLYTLLGPRRLRDVAGPARVRIIVKGLT